MKTQEKTQEQFKKIKGYPKYLISNFGVVISLNYYRTKKATQLTAVNNSVGYPMINLHKEGSKQKTVYIHRLVSEHFLPKSNNKKRNEVHHIDNNKENNNIENLMWVTRKENMMFASDTIKGSIPRGEDHWSTKLKDHQILEMRKLYNNEEYNITELTKIFGSSHKTISNIVNHKSWTHI